MGVALEMLGEEGWAARAAGAKARGGKMAVEREGERGGCQGGATTAKLLVAYLAAVEREEG